MNYEGSAGKIKNDNMASEKFFDFLFDALSLIHIEMCIRDRHCRDDAASLSEHDWYAMITNLAPFEGCLLYTSRCV